MCSTASRWACTLSAARLSGNVRTAPRCCFHNRRSKSAGRPSYEAACLSVSRFTGSNRERFTVANFPSMASFATCVPLDMPRTGCVISDIPGTRDTSGRSPARWMWSTGPLGASSTVSWSGARRCWGPISTRCRWTVASIHTSQPSGRISRCGGMGGFSRKTPSFLGRVGRYLSTVLWCR